MNRYTNRTEVVTEHAHTHWHRNASNTVYGTEEDCTEVVEGSDAVGLFQKTETGRPPSAMSGLIERQRR